VVRLTATVLAWPISRERNVPKTSKLFRRLPTPRAITRIRFEVKRSKVDVTRSITAETKSGSLYELNFKLGRRLKHAISTAMTSYKGLVKLGYCTWARAYHVGRTRDGHTTCYKSERYVVWCCSTARTQSNLTILLRYEGAIFRCVVLSRVNTERVSARRRASTRVK